MRLVPASRATTRDSVGSVRIADPQNSGSVFQADASCHMWKDQSDAAADHPAATIDVSAVRQVASLYNCLQMQAGKLDSNVAQTCVVWKLLEPIAGTRRFPGGWRNLWRAWTSVESRRSSPTACLMLQKFAGYAETTTQGSAAASVAHSAHSEAWVKVHGILKCFSRFVQ